MNENNEISQIAKEIDEKLSFEFENNKRIVDCLNQFERIVENDPSFIRPLVIRKKAQRVIFDLVQFKINYIKEALIVENSLEELSLMIFELLFLLNDKLNYDQLDEKISIFQIILNMLDNKPEVQKEKIFINKVSSEKVIWKDLVNELSREYGAIGFLLCIFIKFSKNKEDIVKFFIYYLKLSCACFVRFNYKELKDLPEESIVKDLSDIIHDKKDEDGFELKIIGKKIKKYSLNKNQILKALNDEQEDSSLGDDDLKNIIKNPEEIKIIDTSKQIGDSSNIQLQKVISETIGDETEKETNKELIILLKKRINRLEKKMKNMNKNTYDLQTDLADAKDDLKLIKARAAFKAFIDFFYRGLNLNGKYDYGDKLDDILYGLNSFNDSKLYDILKVNKVRTLLRKCYEKYLLGNNNAHHMNLNKSVVDQIFEIIDPEKENEEIQKCLKESIFEGVVSQVVATREKYFSKKDKNKLKELEDNIYSTIKPNTISSIFILKK